MTLLVVDNLAAGYGRREIVTGASLSINNAEIVLFVGPNGSGKTTLLRALYHLCDFRADKILFKESDTRRASIRSLIDAGLRYTPQYRAVFDRLTARENVEVAVSSVKGKRHSDPLFDGIPQVATFLDKPAGQLSGGQRKLLSLAMGLSGRPDLLLLDEPLAGLDERSVAVVSTVIEEERKSRGTAFLIVEHRFSKLTSIADHCYGMKLGKIIVDLPVSDIRDEEKFGRAMQSVFFS